jgi:hypothetical protein
MKTSAIFAIASLVSLAGLANTCTASAFAFYNFDGDLSNSIGSSYQMTALVRSSGSYSTYSPATYSTSTVFGTSGESYLSLAATQALDVDTSALANKSCYSIVMDVRTSDVTDYNKLISLDGGTSDNGVYFKSGTVTFYPLGTGSVPVTANEWVRIALTYDGTTMKLYCGDGTSFALANSGVANSYYTLANMVQLLTDDSTTSYRENHGVDIANLWLFDTALTYDELTTGNLDSSTVPETSEYAASMGIFALVSVVIARRRRAFSAR